MATARMQDVTIEWAAEPIEVDSLYDYRPVPDWSATDDHGHVHHVTDDGTFPTLREFEVSVHWCEMCRDEHGEYEYRCIECLDVVDISGAFKDHGPTRSFLRGPESVTVTTPTGKWIATRPGAVDELRVAMGKGGDMESLLTEDRGWTRY